MKIRTNFDLIEETTMAKKGFSLKRYEKEVASTTTFCTVVLTPAYIIENAEVIEILALAFNSIRIATVLYGVADTLLREYKKAEALENLSILANRLGNIYIDTNAEMLMEAKRYKTEFKVNFEQFPPKLEEHKYIMVPVNNDWGNNERSLHQEHVIGTNDYDLSYGEPEKEKVYSLGTKKAIK